MFSTVAVVLTLAPWACLAAEPFVVSGVEASIHTAGGPLENEAVKEVGVWNLWNNGDVGEYIEVDKGGTYVVTVRAGGTPAAGEGPMITVRVDGRDACPGGKTVTSQNVKPNMFDNYEFLVDLTPGVHRLVVTFLNDLAIPVEPGSTVWKEDRNAYIAWIRIAPVKVDGGANAGDGNGGGNGGDNGDGGGTIVKSDARRYAQVVAQREKEVLAMTNEQIEKHRKTDVTIRVLSADGKPVANAAVSVALRRHEFLFGCNIYMFDRFGSARENELYRERFAALFNYATTGFYWRSYEPKQGQPDYAYTDKVVAWCAANSIRVKGHPLLWDCEYGVPEWSDGQPAADVQRKRVEDILTRYKGKIAAYEVVNEPAHLPELKIDQPHVWARNADPTACLIVNDYEVLGTGCPPFFDLLAKAIKAGVPIDGIGIQAHEPLFMRFPLDGVKETLDHYATLGKPLHITEFTPTSGGQKILGGEGMASETVGMSGGVDIESRVGEGRSSKGTVGEATWTETAQADYAEKFYRICFAHPAVVAITWWDFCDVGAWQEGGGMLRKDLSPKPVYDALKKLIKSEWTTITDGKTNAEGTWQFRGFRGQYDVTVNGKAVEGQWETTPATEGTPAIWTIWLAR